MTEDSNESRIRELIESWAKAARDKNMDGVLAHHAKDIVMFDVPLPLQSKGIEAYKKTWELFFDSNPGGKGSFELRELQIAAGDTVAFCHALLIAGSAKKPQGRLTIGLKKIRGKWMIVHEHHSYPIKD
jgi:ketosteroid isomerase-like protein